MQPMRNCNKKFLCRSLIAANITIQIQLCIVSCISSLQFNSVIGRTYYTTMTVQDNARSRQCQCKPPEHLMVEYHHQKINRRITTITELIILFLEFSEEIRPRKEKES